VLLPELPMGILMKTSGLGFTTTKNILQHTRNAVDALESCSRPRYIRELVRAVIAAASDRVPAPIAIREPSGWERVDRTLAKARKQLDTASAEEDYQAIGLLCREVMISLAQAVYDPSIHVSEDGVTPSATDANRMLEAYIRHVFPGESYKEVRAHARAALALALNVQHRRTATRQLAELCLEAAMSTTAVISIISSRTG
jgi:hypothetical protein